MIWFRPSRWITAAALAAVVGCQPSGDRTSPAPASMDTARRDSIAREGLTLGTLEGTQWILDRWSETELAGTDVEVTLRLEDGRFVGSAGCNNYFCQVTPGEARGAIAVGPPAGSLKACPEPAMSVEDRFLGRLAAVKSFRLVEGRLGLVYELAGESGTMLFRAQPGR